MALEQGLNTEGPSPGRDAGGRAFNQGELHEQRPKDRRVAILWCCWGKWGEAAEGVMRQLANARPGPWPKVGRS